MTNTNESKWRGCTTTFAKRDNPFESEIVEVVETGALDELRTQLAAAKEENENLKQTNKATHSTWKSAFNNLTEENARLKAELSEYKNVPGLIKKAEQASEVVDAYLQITKLTEKLRVAKVALEDISQVADAYIWTTRPDAKLALAKLEDGNE